MNLTNRLRECWTHVFAPATSDELISTIEWCVEQVEPQLKQVRGYPQCFEAAVAHALAHCQRLAQQIRAPIHVERHAYMHDPVVRALFVKADDIPVVLSKSPPVRDWHRSQVAPDFVALMGVRLKEKQVFAMALEGDMLRRDVAQKVVMFSDHTISALAEDEPAVRTLLLREFLDALLKHVRDRITSLRATRQEKVQQRNELQAQLRAKPSMQAQAHLEQCLRELNEIDALLDLKCYADYFDAVLLKPEQYVNLLPISVSMDGIGVCYVGGNTPSSDGIHDCLELCELVGRDRRRWLVTLVKCNRHDLDAAGTYPDRLAEAGRWLAI
jgi:hypothetical protein